MSAGFSLHEPQCITGAADQTKYFPPEGMPTSSQQLSRIAYAYMVEGIGDTVVNEVQRIDFDAPPTTGTWTITFDGDTTSALAFDADADTIETALEALASIGSGNIDVQGDCDVGFQLTFIGTLGGANQPEVTVDTSGLDENASVSTVINGSTTTPSIVLKVQVSFDAPSSHGGSVANMTWYDLASSNVTITADTSGVVGPVPICAPYYRVAYIRTSGTGGTVEVDLFGRKE